MVAYDPKKGSGSMGRTLFLFFSFFTYIVPCLLLGFIVYREVTDEKQKETEFISRIDHLAENRNWDAILQNVTPEMTKKNSSLLRWILLALSEKGQLPERMFAYGVTEPACFFYERVDKQFCRNFNMQFFRALELDNELLHNAFQAGILSPYGNSFRSMRAIVDACVHQGRNRMLAKYVEVMKHTSCHTKQAQLLGEYLALAGVEDKINSGKNTSPFL